MKEAVSIQNEIDMYGLGPVVLGRIRDLLTDNSEKKAQYSKGIIEMFNKMQKLTISDGPRQLTWDEIRPEDPNIAEVVGKVLRPLLFGGGRSGHYHENTVKELSKSVLQWFGIPEDPTDRLQERKKIEAQVQQLEARIKMLQGKVTVSKSRKQALMRERDTLAWAIISDPRSESGLARLRTIEKVLRLIDEFTPPILEEMDRLNAALAKAKERLYLLGAM